MKKRTAGREVFIIALVVAVLCIAIGINGVWRSFERFDSSIITEKDIFQAFTDLLGYKHQGTRFVFQCDDRPGFFAGIAQLLADNEANMEAMAVYHTKARGTEAVVKATGEISVKSMVDILVNAGYKLNNVTQTTKFGTTKTFDV